MSTTTNGCQMYTGAPPSYSEAVYGTPATTQQEDSKSNQQQQQIFSPVRQEHNTTPITPAVSHSTGYSLNNSQSTYSYNWPPQLEPLTYLSALLVYPDRSNVYKIKNINKEVIFKAKKKNVADCCACETQNTFMIMDLQGQALIYVNQIGSTAGGGSCNCDSPMQLDVSFHPDVAVGRVHAEGSRHFRITNVSGDSLLSVHQESSFLSVKPFEIYSADNQVIGKIGDNNGIKNTVTFPSDLQIKCKALLLALTLIIQMEEDNRRRSD